MRTLFEIVTEKGTAEDIRGLMSRKDRIEAAADALDSREGKFLDPESRAILISGLEAIREVIAESPRFLPGPELIEIEAMALELETEAEKILNSP